jgi:hypothetical protein
MISLSSFLIPLVGMPVLLAQLDPPPAPAQQFYQDLRAGKPRHASLRWMNLDGSETVEADERGLRITLPATRRRTEPAGFEFPFTAKGDFEVTAGYEIIGTDRPKTARGVGFELFVTTWAPTDDALSFSCVRRPDGSEMFWCGHNITVGGKRQHEVKNAPAIAMAGRLRIVRSKGQAVFQAAPGADEGFREMARLDIGPEALKVVRLAAYPNNSSEPVDIRIVDVRVRAEDLGVVNDDFQATAQAGPSGKPKRWLGAATGFGLFAILALVALAVRLRRQRQNRLAESVSPPQP